MSPRCAVVLVAALAACGDDPRHPPPAAGGAAGAGGQDAAPCAPAQAREGGRCLETGVETCASGFRADGHGGCAPVLPPAPCAAGEMALLGDTACRPVATCGEGTWGDIPTEWDAEHVDPAYAGGGSDGSRSRPWTSLYQALVAVRPGGLVALAEGVYSTRTPDFPEGTRIWGRCPQKVQLGTRDALTLFLVNKPGVELHTLAIVGHEGGVTIGARDVLLDRVWVHDTNLVGVLATQFNDRDVRPRVRIFDSLFEDNGGAAIAAAGADIEVVRTVVRDSLAEPAGHARAIDVSRSYSPSSGCSTRRSSRARTRGESASSTRPSPCANRWCAARSPPATGCGASACRSRARGERVGRDLRLGHRR